MKRDVNIGSVRDMKARMHAGRRPDDAGVFHPVSAAQKRVEVRDIEINLIQPDPKQPRKHFPESSLAELATTIRQKGVLQPVRVTSNGDGTFRLIYGERRWRAAQLAGLSAVPCIVAEESEDDHEIRLIENLQKEDLAPEDLAAAVVHLLEGKNLTQEQAAEKIGRKQPYVAKCVSINKFLSASGVVDFVENARARGDEMSFNLLYSAASQPTPTEGLTYLQHQLGHPEQGASRRVPRRAPAEPVRDVPSAVRKLRSLRRRISVDFLAGLHLTEGQATFSKELDATISEMERNLKYLIDFKDRVRGE